MDLSTIKRRLTKQSANRYTSVEGFLADIRLVIANCATYNAVSSPLYTLSLYTLSLVCVEKAEIDSEKTDMTPPHHSFVIRTSYIVALYLHTWMIWQVMACEIVTYHLHRIETPGPFSFNIHSIYLSYYHMSDDDDVTHSARESWFKHILFSYRVHRRRLGAALSATLASPF